MGILLAFAVAMLVPAIADRISIGNSNGKNA
jgi:hypothetical protein